jgi:predicted flap endonuclease-1-like 5' DNA nuclease
MTRHASAGRVPDGDFPAGIGSPARRALAAAGYVRLDQLAGVSEAELLKLHGVGPKAVEQLRRALRAQGLDFAGNL